MVNRALRFLEREQGSAGKLGGGDRKIRCPKCAWSPERKDRWSCVCGHSWNTFDTRGICPACDAAWADTACPQCHAWSPHERWYADDPQA